MGKKGDKHSSDTALAAENLLSKLSPIEGISSKKMFGGYGIFHEGKMFGMVNSKGVCYLKADATSSAAYLEKGSEKHNRMPYYSIPDAVFENLEEFLEWANTAIAASKA